VVFLIVAMTAGFAVMVAGVRDVCMLKMQRESMGVTTVKRMRFIARLDGYFPLLK
jgi:hypothetical protein